MQRALLRGLLPGKLSPAYGHGVPAVFERVVTVSYSRTGMRMISMRRFSARPSGVSLSATGRYSP